jgi:hypothetical protein
MSGTELEAAIKARDTANFLVQELRVLKSFYCESRYVGAKFLEEAQRIEFALTVLCENLIKESAP